MEAASFDGQFWLPEHTDRRIPGTLSLDDEHGLMLLLHGDLRKTEVPESGRIDLSGAVTGAADVMHGVLHDDQKLVTLFDVAGSYLPMPSAYSRSLYGVRLAMLGALIIDDRFVSVDIEFDFLRAWARPSSRIEPDEPGVIRVRSDNLDLARADLAGGWSLLLYSGIVGSWGDEETNVREYCSFRLTPPEPQASKVLLSRGIQPLQDLLTVSLGRPVALTGIRLRDCDPDPVRAKVVEALLYHDQHSTKPRPPGSLDRYVQKYDTPTLLWAHSLAGRLPPVPLSELLRRWCDGWEAQKNVLQLLLGPILANFMALEHRYSSTFQSAESLHQLMGLGSQDVSKQSHPERQARVLEALSSAGLGAEDARWAGNVLASRNDKSLSRKIDDLLDNAGAVGTALREAVVDESGASSFGRDASQLRGGVAHPSTPDFQLQERRRVFIHALRWLVRGHVIAGQLQEGDREPFWQAAAARSHFGWIIDALKQGKDAE